MPDRDYNEASRQLPEMIPYDLMDFGCAKLSESGELEVPRYFKDNVYVQLGHDILEVSGLSFEAITNPEKPVKQNDIYAVRNVSPGVPYNSLSFDLKQHEIGEVDSPSQDRYHLYARSTHIIGRATTPELSLSDTVSRQHVRIRIGNMRGNIHFADLYSKNGTIVYLSPDDSQIVHAKLRRVAAVGTDRTYTPEEINGRWTRY